ncbi:MarP family serine protease [Dermatophilus congolensis]|uniref:Serine protease Rv3671c n=1 Tax=Dermatophilus congolensis TaxID=1863 RepID=A0A239VCA5_9MICO|nr:MarP family serine protease [Dermatophilus congolensis]MBO3130642.1 MarP family serine protease [Dermatophilus congolensis]MBO3130728.1 MarP family serine protease [Dermatophilus congolensis]MBO3135115.1 MarP family serine protease [Dermatophilus congolensis]MBO3137354.1 MarP family serine protease [Dermatophilus congolensis]MBO3139595.1 MarP family serine protease [Dermatophilus congolensis]
MNGTVAWAPWGLVVDAVVLLILWTSVTSGWRRGFIGSLFGAAGFAAGGILGVAVLPGALANKLPPQWAASEAAILVMLILVLAAITQGVLERIAMPLISCIRASWARYTDAFGGAAVQFTVAAVALWVATGLLALSPIPALKDGISASRSLHVVDNVMPATRDAVLEQALVALDAYQFPRVFTDQEPPDVRSVQPPDKAIASNEALRAASESIYRIDALALRCNRSQEGTGWALTSDTIVTNAHVVAGADRISVRVKNERHSAHLIAFDPARDLALLKVEDLQAQPLPRAERVSRKEALFMAGYPLGGPYSTQPGRIATRMNARGADIYGQGQAIRQIYVVRGDVRPGNSGGPALTVDGRVAGVVFARSTTENETAYVLTLKELDEFLTERPAPPAQTLCAA